MRDKERHRKMMEERKQTQVESPTQSEDNEYMPLTPLSTVSITSPYLTAQSPENCKLWLTLSDIPFTDSIHSLLARLVNV